MQMSTNEESKGIDTGIKSDLFVSASSFAGVHVPKSADVLVAGRHTALTPFQNAVERQRHVSYNADLAQPSIFARGETSREDKTLSERTVMKYAPNQMTKNGEMRAQYDNFEGFLEELRQQCTQDDLATVLTRQSYPNESMLSSTQSQASALFDSKKSANSLAPESQHVNSFANAFQRHLLQHTHNYVK
jgi:hypothetical protein